jgi:Prokaryotic E2 family E
MRTMPLLLDEDYEELVAQGFEYVEDEPQRYLVLRDYKLIEGLYQQGSCDVLVIIPPNYPHAGNDMFWTYPRLVRVDNQPIPATNDPGTGDNRLFESKEFCRWSRHWRSGPSAWKSGTDRIVTILRRIEWALRKPDTK